MTEFGGTKTSRGGKKAIKGAKNSVDLFFLFFRHQGFCGAPKKSAGGANCQMVTLRHCVLHRVKCFFFQKC